MPPPPRTLAVRGGARARPARHHRAPAEKPQCVGAWVRARARGGDPTTGESTGNKASWRGPTGRGMAQFPQSREFIGNAGRRVGPAGAAAGGARGFRGHANCGHTTPPLVQRQGVRVKLWVGGLYGTDLRSRILAVSPAAVLFLSRWHARARWREHKSAEVFSLEHTVGDRPLCTAGRAPHRSTPPPADATCAQPRAHAAARTGGARLCAHLCVPYVCPPLPRSGGHTFGSRPLCAPSGARTHTRPAPDVRAPRPRRPPPGAGMCQPGPAHARPVPQCVDLRWDVSARPRARPPGAAVCGPPRVNCRATAPHVRPAGQRVGRAHAPAAAHVGRARRSAGPPRPAPPRPGRKAAVCGRVGARARAGWRSHHRGKHGKQGFLAGADRARNGPVSPISGIYWKRGAPGGAGGGRRGRGAGVSGTCKLWAHDSPTCTTSGGPGKIVGGGPLRYGPSEQNPGRFAGGSVVFVALARPRAVEGTQICGGLFFGAHRGRPPARAPGGPAPPPFVPFRRTPLAAHQCVRRAGPQPLNPSAGGRNVCAAAGPRRRAHGRRAAMRAPMCALCVPTASPKRWAHIGHTFARRGGARSPPLAATVSAQFLRGRVPCGEVGQLVWRLAAIAALRGIPRQRSPRRKRVWGALEPAPPPPSGRAGWAQPARKGLRPGVTRLVPPLEWEGVV